MTQSLSQVLLHIVFSTKNREPFLVKSIRDDIHAYVAGCLKSHGSYPYLVNGVADHIHIACSLPRTLSISELIEKVKRSSSHKAKELLNNETFAWQTGYGVFSFGQSQLQAVCDYIKTQEEHHADVTFHDEYLKFLEKYNIDFDSKYIFS